MPAYFITAPGTDIGKTLITAALCWQLREQGKKVQCLKPVMTGVDGQNWKESDAAVLLSAMGKKVDALALKEVSPWRFADPISPHLAARNAGIELDVEAMADFCEAALGDDKITLIEGAGGLMTPLNDRFTMLDLIQALETPVILICGSYVGAISHSLTALSVLRARNVPVQAVLINETPESATSVVETAEAISHFGGLNLPVYTLPRMEVAEDLWKDIPNLTEMLR